MSIYKYTESDLENATLEWLADLNYKVVFGPDIAPDGENPERQNFSDVLLESRLRSALGRINSKVPEVAIEDAIDKLKGLPFLNPDLVFVNRAFHRMLTDGIDVAYKDETGVLRGDKVYLLDRIKPDNNDWLAVNQFTVIEDNRNRRPDVVMFVNGIPLVVFELKNPADENVNTRQAFNQIQTYKDNIRSLFAYNAFCIISDGIETKAGSLTADFERFMKWRTIDGEGLASSSLPEMEVVLRGMFEKERLLDIVTNFIIFDTDGNNTFKILAAYHQYHATNKALTRTLEASGRSGDQRCGVVWHTQGSGKSLTMLFYAGKLIQELNNPTLVMLTDRNDLDDQLFGVFGRASELLRQTPVQAEDRDHLKNLLKVASGGVVFTTIQKFFPEHKDEKHPILSDRKNIIVIADEAHRSQYGFKSTFDKNEDAFTYGFAQHLRDALPGASYIGFTGTPVELADANTRAVFGEYIDIYDIAQAVEDHATVPIYYEARLAKIELKESERPKIDKDFEDLTEGEEIYRKEELKSRWARLEAMVGANKRIALVAKDIVEHFEARLGVIDGKGMIVAMSRRIAVELYDEIIKLRPSWHSPDEDKGFLKVIMTGSASDPLNYQKHIPSKQGKELLAKRMKNPKDELKLVIVRDMWLTGFDAPSLHTMYIDKPMQGHGLMQAIARVNRVYKDKQGGLVVDYIGIAPALKEALINYTASGSGRPTVPQEEAVSVMIEKYEIVQGIFHSFDYSEFFSGKAIQKEKIRAGATDYILGLSDGPKRFQKAVTELSYAYSLAVPHIEAARIRDEVAFFQVIKSSLSKLAISTKGGPTEEDYDQAIRQIVSNAIVSNEVVDVFKAAGLNSPNVSVLSDEFLQEVQHMEHKNTALELLKRLLNDEIKNMAKKHLVKSRSFLEMLINTIKKYQNKTIEAAQVIAELVELAKQVRDEKGKGADLGLREDEVAFYDALCANESAVLELGDATLKLIAQELVVLLRKNTTIDWTLRENVQAKLRVYVKRLLNKHRYPPDKQEVATQTVLEQAEILCKDWSGEAESNFVSSIN